MDLMQSFKDHIPIGSDLMVVVNRLNYTIGLCKSQLDIGLFVVDRIAS